MALEIQNFINYCFTQKNYAGVLKKLRREVKQRKIRVLFYVCETSKWAFQPLYDLMSKDDIFEPFIVIGMLNHVARGVDKTRNNAEETFEFFKTRNMNVYMGVDGNKRIPLKKFAPDIVFYEQQWELPKTHKPYNVSKYALTCYSYYSLPLFDYRGDYSRKFHKIVYRVFADSEENLKRYEAYEGGKLNNYIVTGYSKLDVYADNNPIDLAKIWKEPEKIKIIYAPHHSFGKSVIDVATFEENGRYILDLAKRHPETTWIFKPHPAFKDKVLKNNVMTENEIDEYFNEWREIGRVYTQGDYFDIFKSSDLMISDCCSFLAEYLPTERPLIRPIRNSNIRLNGLGEKVVEGYYQTCSNEELEQVFEQLVVDQKDSKKVIRLNSIKNVYNKEEKSVIKVIRELKDCLGV